MKPKKKPRPICKFCRREFKNAQGVRAHLRFCVRWKETCEPEWMPRHVPRHELPRHVPKQLCLGRTAYDWILPPDPRDGLDPRAEAVKELKAEEVRLRRRQVDDAHRQLDEYEAQRDTEREARQAEQDDVFIPAPPRRRDPVAMKVEAQPLAADPAKEIEEAFAGFTRELQRMVRSVQDGRRRTRR